MTLLTNILASVLANIVFWLGLGGLVWVLARYSRKRFMSFFGLTSDRSLKAYLANAGRIKGGSTRHVFISGHDFRASRTLSVLLDSSPFRYPELVRGLVDGIFVGSRINFSIDICPENPELIRDSSIVIVGGAARNTVRRYYVQTHQTLIVNSQEETGVDSGGSFEKGYWRITRGPRVDETLGRGVNSAIIERFIDSNRSRVVITCAGIRADSTWAAVEYLARHWSKLHRQFGERPFAIALEFPQGHPDSYLHEYVEPQVLATITG